MFKQIIRRFDPINWLRVGLWVSLIAVLLIIGWNLNLKPAQTSSHHSFTNTDFTKTTDTNPVLDGSPSHKMPGPAIGRWSSDSTERPPGTTTDADKIKHQNQFNNQTPYLLVGSNDKKCATGRKSTDRGFCARDMYIDLLIDSSVDEVDLLIYDLCHNWWDGHLSSNEATTVEVWGSAKIASITNDTSQGTSGNLYRDDCANETSGSQISGKNIGFPEVTALDSTNKKGHHRVETLTLTNLTTTKPVKENLIIKKNKYNLFVIKVYASQLNATGVVENQYKYYNLFKFQASNITTGNDPIISFRASDENASLKDNPDLKGRYFNIANLVYNTYLPWSPDNGSGYLKNEPHKWDFAVDVATPCNLTKTEQFIGFYDIDYTPFTLKIYRQPRGSQSNWVLVDREGKTSTTASNKLININGESYSHEFSTSGNNQLQKISVTFQKNSHYRLVFSGLNFRDLVQVTLPFSQYEAFVDCNSDPSAEVNFTVCSIELQNLFYQRLGTNPDLKVKVERINNADQVLETPYEKRLTQGNHSLFDWGGVNAIDDIQTLKNGNYRVVITDWYDGTTPKQFQTPTIVKQFEVQNLTGGGKKFILNRSGTLNKSITAAACETKECDFYTFEVFDPKIDIEYTFGNPITNPSGTGKIKINQAKYTITGQTTLTGDSTVTAGGNKPIVDPGGSIVLKTGGAQLISLNPGDYDYIWDIEYQERRTEAIFNRDGSINTPARYGPKQTADCQKVLRLVKVGFFKVFGGDISAGGAIGTSNSLDNCRGTPYLKSGYDPTSAKIYGYSLHRSTNLTDHRGASTQYALMANGSVKGVYSTTDPIIGLTYANQAPSTGSPYFAGGLTASGDNRRCLNNYWRFADKVTNSKTANSINLASEVDNYKSYLYTPASGSSVTITGSLPATVTNLTIYVDGDVVIDNNIILAAGSLTKRKGLRDVGFILIVARGNLYIDYDVDRVDALLVAYPSYNQRKKDIEKGVIYTCANSDQATNDYGDCSHQLTINGALVGRQVRLGRLPSGTTTGVRTLLDEPSAAQTNTTYAAEVINLWPDYYVGIPILVPPLGWLYQPSGIYILPPNF